jgi:hypothetical protein
VSVPVNHPKGGWHIVVTGKLAIYTRPLPRVLGSLVSLVTADLNINDWAFRNSSGVFLMVFGACLLCGLLGKRVQPPTKPLFTLFKRYLSAI